MDDWVIAKGYRLIRAEIELVPKAKTGPKSGLFTSSGKQFGRSALGISGNMRSRCVKLK